MNVVHIIGGSEQRGASIGALTLHNALVSKGIGSSVLIQKSLPGPGISSLSRSMVGTIQQLLLRRLDKLPLIPYGRRNKRQLFSVGWTGNQLQNQKLVREADIVHLHWINGGMLSVSSLSQFRNPVVWTIRDMWSFTGGCHYSLDCEKYKRGCGACPILSSRSESDLSRRMTHAKKHQITPNVHLVAISEWLRRAAESSMVLSGRSLHVIHNGVDLSQYYPMDKVEAKRKLNIDENKRVLLFGSQYVTDPYKGFSLFLNSLEQLDMDRYVVLILGNTGSIDIPLDPNKRRILGFLRTTREMRIAYSASDVTVTPSLQEAFGKVMIESMACRTPVVAFRTSGPLDIVSHRHNGYLASPYDSTDLARGITWVIDNPNYSTLCDEALCTAKTKFDINKIADCYIRLYQDLA